MHAIILKTVSSGTYIFHEIIEDLNLQPLGVMVVARKLHVKNMSRPARFTLLIQPNS